ncbi:hypothetical protein [Dickeya chrysanthemi]|nr:hypothetical protein [Dickeya chrysanthemi]
MAGDPLSLILIEAEYSERKAVVVVVCGGFMAAMPCDGGNIRRNET